MPPSGYSWRFARRVGNVGAAALAGAVNLARIPPAQSVKLVTESILIGPPGASGESPCAEREPAQRYSTWKRGTRSSAPC